MILWHAIILGLIQGLGEFLPISSSGHLVITRWLFGFDDSGLVFDILLHFGTLVATLIYFRHDWAKLLRAAFSSLKKPSKSYTADEKLFWLIIFASIPGAFLGFLLKDIAEAQFRHNPLLTALMMSLMGILLFLSDQSSKKKKEMHEIGLKEALLIGFAQALSIIPGVSRSGSTITAALALGFSRTASARFSFFLAVPIILGASLLGAAKIAAHPESLGGSLKEPLVGVGIAAIIGFLSIKYMLRYVQKYSYRIFVAYRFLFSVVVVLVYLFRNDGV